MKGLIVGGGVDTPLYQVKLIHDTTFHDKEVNDIKATIAKINERLAVAEKNWVDAVIERDALPTNATQSELAVVQDKIDVAYNQKTRYAALIKIANERLSFIESHKVADKTVDAWCSDYTLGLSGEVGLCEQLMSDGTKRYTIYPDAKDPNSPHNADFQADVNGKLAEAQALVAKHEAQKANDEAQLKQMKSLYDAGRIPKAQALVDAVRISFAKLQATLGKLEQARKQVSAIQRGIAMLANYNGRKSAYIAQNDGRQVETLTTPPRTWFINAAREPWRYKWKPQFMAAKVVANDTTANTLDVSLEQPKLGLAKLTVHEGMKSSGIVADYMTMGGSGIYEVGDDVMVEFPSFNPAMPIINGFSVNPRPPYLWADSQFVAVDWVNKISYIQNGNQVTAISHKGAFTPVTKFVVGDMMFNTYHGICVDYSGFFIVLTNSTYAGADIIYKVFFSVSILDNIITITETTRDNISPVKPADSILLAKNSVNIKVKTYSIVYDGLTAIGLIVSNTVQTTNSIEYTTGYAISNITLAIYRTGDFSYVVEVKYDLSWYDSAKIIDPQNGYALGSNAYFPAVTPTVPMGGIPDQQLPYPPYASTPTTYGTPQGVYTLVKRKVENRGAVIVGTAWRKIPNTIWYDKKGDKQRQGVTTTPRWKLCKPTDAGATILTNGKYVCPAPL